MNFLYAYFEYIIEEFAYYNFIRESLYVDLIKLLKY